MSWLSPYRWLLLGGLILALVLGVNRWNAHQRDIGYDKAVAEYTAAALVATQAARAKEQALQTKVNEAQHAAKIRETKLAADAGRARSESERLRGDLAAIRGDLPRLTRDAVNRYADAASIVFDQCQREYQDMAANADRLASDRQTLIDAWPK